jgi:hypothetical protein
MWSAYPNAGEPTIQARQARSRNNGWFVKKHGMHAKRKDLLPFQGVMIRIVNHGFEFHPDPRGPAA